jgi:hypothetical protein
MQSFTFSISSFVISTRFLPLIGCVVVAAIFCIAISDKGETAEHEKPLRPGTFQVTVSKGKLSLEASQAPLAQVLEEIGKQARIMIDGYIRPEEKITTSLNGVPIEDGIKQLAKNVSVFYAQGPNDKTRRIERIVILSEVKERPPPQPKASSQPEKRSEASELDPKKSGDNQKAGKQP